ncbi:MAG: hypothetical protein ACE5HC_08790 [Candidatus Binatia bacterium]
MSPSKHRLPTVRVFHLACALLLFLSIVYSTPHHVHHMFSGHQGNPCLALSITKDRHITPMPLATLFVNPMTTRLPAVSVEAAVPPRVIFPYSTRAPPLA